MKLILPFLFFLFISESSAQTQNTDTTKSDINSSVKEVQPEYPGGFDKLYDFILSNMKYPEDAIKAGIEGKVYVQFIIDENGKAIEPKVLRGLSASLDAEAIRLVSIMPNWKPGTQNGKPVRVRYNMPISFRIP